MGICRSEKVTSSGEKTPRSSRRTLKRAACGGVRECASTVVSEACAEMARRLRVYSRGVGRRNWVRSVKAFAGTRAEDWVRFVKATGGCTGRMPVLPQCGWPRCNRTISGRNQIVKEQRRGLDPGREVTLGLTSGGCIPYWEGNVKQKITLIVRHRGNQGRRHGGSGKGSDGATKPRGDGEVWRWGIMGWGRV